MCDRTYTALSGSLSSPYWPDKYSIPRYCRLMIDIEPEKRILLAFQEFTLDGLDLFHPARTETDVCLCGVLVEVRDDGSRLNRYCGTKKPFAWLSETDKVTVEFITPYSLVFNRFIASYTTVNKKTSCYQFIDLTGFVEDEMTGVPLPQEGFIHSLNFPNAYPDNQNCEYVLHANPEHRIVLYFDEFELEPGPTCDADYVKIEDCYSRRSNVYCGKHHPFSWVSDSNEIWITFRTNGNQVYSGFLLAYELMDRESANTIVLEDDSGSFTSPGYPLIYHSDKSVEYIVRTDPRNLLVITFHDFQLERDDYGAPLPLQIVKRSTLNEYQNHYGDPYSQCVDYVKIIDIYDNHVETYCGRIPVFSYISRSNELLIQFKTDSSMNYRGFNASYRAIPRRVPNDWELLYRVARGGETEAVNKFLFEARGYNEFNPNAKATTITRSRATYKHSDVPDWANIGIRKVKVDVFNAGSIIASFRFDGQASNLSNWFECERMIYSSYNDLNSLSCSQLFFGLPLGAGDVQEFEIRTFNASVGCDSDPSHRVWLDLQDVESPRNCTYEAPDNRLINSIIFVSSAGTGGETALGANIAEADVFTIWVQRDCDERISPVRDDAVSISSNGNGIRDYRNNEYCDFYLSVHPFDRILLEFSDFELEEDECLANDYVQIENTETAFAQTFCGVQHQVMWTTTANAALLRFRTDSVVTYNGWGASVTAERRNLEDCSTVTVNPPGNVTNPDHPNSLQEYRYYACEYIVHAHPQDRVIFSFSSFIFQTENPPEMQINPRSSQQNFIEVSGSLYPFSWTSDTNELALSYHAPLPYRTYILFEGDYRTLEAPRPATCQQFFDADIGGSFSWPTESLSTGLQNCYVIVRTDPDESRRVQITFKNLKMPQSDCNSYINTLDTTSRRNDMYCQRIRIPFAWTSDANEVVIQFFHGPTFALHQVEVEYRSRARVRPDDAQVFTDLAGGAFSSPNYPHPYDSDTQMEYLLHAPAEHLVIVVFKDFSIEGAIEPSHLRERVKRNGESTEDLAAHFKHMYKRQTIVEPPTPECRYDFVRVEDVLENRETTYCGDQQPFGVATQGNEALVLFQTDRTVEKRGFDALYAFEPRPAISDCGDLFTEDFGTLQSPGYPSYYPNVAYCRTVIQVNPKDRIIINFRFLNLEDDLTCSKDYLELRDVVTGRSEKYCGRRTTAFTWRSDTNLVFLTFVSDNSNSAPGYDATYTTEDRSDEPTCIHNITATAGTIHSPRFPRDYANQLKCEFNITVDEGYGIQLSFKEFELEPPAPGSTQCMYDYLQIIDPTTVNAQTAEKLCGLKNPFERKILFHQLSLIFVSDFITFYKGFLVDFQQISLGQNIESCNEELTGPAGYFSSPGYPGNYPDNAFCIILITVAEGYHVVITFNDFNTEGYTGCPYDYVLVEDVNSGLSRRFCGRKQNPFSWTSESNVVSVTFKSDDRTPSSGFYAGYESKPNFVPIVVPVTGCESYYGITEINGDSAIVQSPDYPGFYPLDVDCFVRFATKQGSRCEVSFIVFNLEDSSTCQYDFVKVTSIPDGATKKFCGSRAPFNWLSNSATCEIHFHSDSYVRASGYHAEVAAVPFYIENPQVPYNPYQPYNQPNAPPVPYQPSNQPAPYQPYQPPNEPPAPYQPSNAPPAPYQPPNEPPAPYQPPNAPPAPYQPPNAPPAPYQPPNEPPAPYQPPNEPPAPYQPPNEPPAPYQPPNEPPAPYQPPNAPPAPYQPPNAPPAPYQPPNEPPALYQPPNEPPAPYQPANEPPAPYQPPNEPPAPYQPPNEPPAPYQPPNAPPAPYQPPNAPPAPYQPPNEPPAPYQPPNAPPAPYQPPNAPPAPYQPPNEPPALYQPPNEPPAPYQPANEPPAPYQPPNEPPAPYQPPNEPPAPYQPPNEPPAPYQPPNEPPAPYQPPNEPPAPYQPPNAPPAPYQPPNEPPAPYQPPNEPPAPYQPPNEPPAPYQPPNEPPAPYQPPNEPPAPYQPPNAPPAPYQPPNEPPAPYQPPNEPPAPATKCVQSLQAQRGVQGSFASPGWPGRYPLMVQCSTTITASGSGRIRIIFSPFQLEDENCQFDYVQISEPLLPGPPEKHCGTKSQLVFESKSGRVVVTFNSDAYVTKQGFLATFTQF
ncbi:cubilin-like [Lytechinus pictus]|uniref:cubilin-like n=1 Tax=Lytechinus pictus TaxID=7653 RepID=UPI0030B9D554